MKNITEFLFEAGNSPELKKLLDELAKYEFEAEAKGYRFRKPTYKFAKKGKGEFKMSIKQADQYINGKNGDQGYYQNNIYVFVKGIEFDGAVYISIVVKNMDYGDGRTWSEDFCVLNSIDGIAPFIKWCLKPHKNKTKSEIGPDGELKIWYEKMPKTFTPEIKPFVVNKRVIDKMGDIVKINCLEDTL